MTAAVERLEKDVAVLISESFAAFDSRSIMTKELVRKTTRRMTRSGKKIFSFTLRNFFIPYRTNNQVSRLCYLTVISSTSVQRSDRGLHSRYSG